MPGESGGNGCMAMASDGLEILDLVAESIIVRDLEGRIQAWNAASEALYGVPRAAALGKLAQDILKTAYPSPVSEIERAVLETGTWEGEVRRASAEGAPLKILARWALRRDGEGYPITIVETGRSVTESKRLEELEASERRYRDLFHYMPIGLTQVDASRIVPLFKELRAQGVTDLKAHIDAHPDFLPRAIDAMLVEEVNEQNVQIFGAQTAAEMHGPVSRYFQAAMPTIRRSIEARYAGVEFFQEEMKATRMDGSVVDVLFATARPGAIADKSLVGFIDITARKKSEEGLRQSEYRYRNMFQAMAASFWELDFSGANELVRGVLKSGITDLRRYFLANPALRAGDDEAYARRRRQRPDRGAVRAWRQTGATRQRRGLLARGEHPGLRRGLRPRRRAGTELFDRVPLPPHRRQSVRRPVYGSLSAARDGPRHHHGRGHRCYRAQAIGRSPARQRAALSELVPGNGSLLLGG